MPQTIKAEIVIEVPDDHVIITNAQYDEYQSLKDDGCWWKTKDIETRYGHQMRWFKDKILYVPKFKKILSTEYGGYVHYPDNEKYWSFEPKHFKKFMEENFPEINR